MSQRPYGVILDDIAVVEDFLILSDGFVAPYGVEVNCACSHARMRLSARTRTFSRRLLQLCVLGLGLLKDGDVGVGVFPEGEEVLVGCAGFGGIALESV